MNLTSIKQNQSFSHSYRSDTNHFKNIKKNSNYKSNIENFNAHHFSNIFVNAPFVQPKLTINQPNDLYEQEADAVAKKVTGNDEPVNLSHTASYNGSSLPLHTRSLMENKFGVDFSQVRVHADTKAAELSAGMHAKAFTHGNNIFFNKNQFAPQTESGKKLLAHELTHVVQQGYAKNVTSTQYKNINNQSPQQQVHVSTKTNQGAKIQRSLLGGILGGIGGALGGALIGGLLGGPIGAIVGGVAGLIGGALLGDTVSTKSRSLTSTEIKYAQDVFKDSIDYTKITITRDSMMATGAPRTIANTINLKSDWGHFKGDGLELTQTGLETLIHEMGHVWQYQNGGLAYIPESLIAQLKAKLNGQSRNAAYDWRGADAAKISWEEWNPEQQAEAIEDYNKLLRKSKDGTATVTELADLSTLLKYMQKVWNKEGAPTYKTADPANAPF